MKGQKMVEILNGYGKVVGCKCIKTTSRQVSLYLTEKNVAPTLSHPNLHKHRGGFQVSQKNIYGPHQNTIATKMKSITSKSVALSPN